MSLFFFFQAEDGIRDRSPSRGLGDVYKRQVSMLIGTVAGVLCYGMMLLRVRKQCDESLDAWAIHGMGGLWGTIATGIFAAAAIGGISGLAEGNSHQFAVNTVSVSYTHLRAHETDSYL